MATTLELNGIGQRRRALRHRALWLQAAVGGNDQPVRQRAAVMEHYGIGQQRPAPRHRALWRLAARGCSSRCAWELREAAATRTSASGTSMGTGRQQVWSSAAATVAEQLTLVTAVLA